MQDDLVNSGDFLVTTNTVSEFSNPSKNSVSNVDTLLEEDDSSQDKTKPYRVTFKGDLIHDKC